MRSGSACNVISLPSPGEAGRRPTPCVPFLMRSSTSYASAVHGATCQPIFRHGKPCSSISGACASKAPGFGCSRLYEKTNASGLGGTPSQARRSWMRRASRPLKSLPQSAASMPINASKDASDTFWWIHLACCWLCTSRLPICTMGKVPGACLRDSPHCFHASKRFGLMPPIAGKSWQPGVKLKVAGIWKSWSVLQAHVVSASYQGDG